MKKYITLLTLILMTGVAHADFWSNCTTYGGTIITANSYGNDKGGLCNDPNDPNLTNNCNGKKFCQGGKTMNWWSAFTWCESIGGKLASFESVCPGAKSVQDTCPNTKGLGQQIGSWTNMGWDNDKVFLVQNGGFYTYGGDCLRNKN